MRELSCAICDSADRIVLYESTLDLRKIEGHPVKPYDAHYRINRCRQCGLVYSSPILASTDVETLYTESAGTNVCDGEWTNARLTAERYYALARPFLTERQRVLDIGCDVGMLLDIAREHGFRELYGLEPNRAAAAVAERLPGATIITDFYERREFPDKYFDLITLVHVMDHLDNPKDVLAKIRRELTPGGVALAVVHNIESLAARVSGERFPPFNLYHHYFFSPTTLRRLFESSHFEVLRVAPTSNSYSLGFLVQKIPFVSERPKRAARRVLDALGIGRLCVTMSLGNIGIVARRPEV